MGYDGSSGSGFTRVESGDVAALPEPETGFVDPFMELPTLSLICSTVAADTKTTHPSDPRSIARRAVSWMQSGGIADEALIAPEFEFHVLDRVDVVTDPHDVHVEIRSAKVACDGRTPTVPRKRG